MDFKCSQAGSRNPLRQSAIFSANLSLRELIFELLGAGPLALVVQGSALERPPTLDAIELARAATDRERALERAGWRELAGPRGKDLVIIGIAPRARALRGAGSTDHIESVGTHDGPHMKRSAACIVV